MNKNLQNKLDFVFRANMQNLARGEPFTHNICNILAR